MFHAGLFELCVPKVSLACMCHLALTASCVSLCTGNEQIQQRTQQQAELTGVIIPAPQSPQLPQAHKRASAALLWQIEPHWAFRNLQFR
eukprot:scaffold292681_cov15-Tisochrysis_lutea.AAC.1